MTQALNELKNHPNWVCWREQAHPTKPDKIKKPIISPVTGVNGSHSNPNDWTTYELAKKFYVENKSSLGLRGLGFVFSANTPFVGIDLDECVTDGHANAFAQRQLKVFGSYAEYSYSGKGIHIIGKTNLIFPGVSENKYNSIEIYRENRFFVMTGKHVEGTPETIEDITTPLSYRVAQPEQTDNHDVTIDDVQEMLSHIPGEGLDYNVWCKILMSVHSKFPGADGKALVDSWTGQYSLKNEIDQKWRSFRKSGVTIGTLIYFAKENGWEKTYTTINPLDRIVPKLTPIQKVQVTKVIEELAEQRAWEIYHKLLLSNEDIVSYSRPVVEHYQLGYRQRNIDSETGEITPGAISVPYFMDSQVVAIEFREDDGQFTYDGKVGLFKVKPMLDEENNYGIVLPDSFLAIDTYLSGKGAAAVYGLPHTILELELPDTELYCIFQRDTPVEMLEVLGAYGAKFIKVKNVKDMLNKLPRNKIEQIARQGKRLTNVI